MTSQELFENPILDVYTSGVPLKTPNLISMQHHVLILNQPVLILICRGQLALWALATVPCGTSTPLHTQK